MQPCHARYCKAKAVSSRSRIAHVKLTTSEAGISRATWQKAKEMEKYQTSTNDSNIFIILVRPSNDRST